MRQKISQMESLVKYGGRPCILIRPFDHKNLPNTPIVLLTLVICSVHSVQYPALQNEEERRADLVEEYRHAESVCRVCHGCATLEEFDVCADFHEDRRTLGEGIRHRKISSGGTQVLDISGPRVRTTLDLSGGYERNNSR